MLESHTAEPPAVAPSLSPRPPAARTSTAAVLSDSVTREAAPASPHVATGSDAGAPARERAAAPPEVLAPVVAAAAERVEHQEPKPEPTPAAFTESSKPLRSVSGSLDASAPSEPAPASEPERPTVARGRAPIAVRVGLREAFAVSVAAATLALFLRAPTLLFAVSAAAVAALFVALRRGPSLQAHGPNRWTSLMLPPALLAAFACAAGLLAPRLLVPALRAATMGMLGLVVAVVLAERMARKGEAARRRAAAAGHGLPGTKVDVGERLTLSSGETVPVDGVVMEGEGTVRPYPHATFEEPRRVGQSVIAGARLASGTLTVQATFVGNDRVLCRLTNREHHTGRMLRWRPVAVFGAPSLALAMGALALWPLSVVEAPLVLLAVLASVPLAGAFALASLRVQRARDEAFSRAIFYRDPAAFDTAASVERLVFCADTAALEGRPEIVSIETQREGDAARVMALARAAAQAVGPAVLSPALAFASRERTSLALMALTQHVGLGVTAQATNGERVVVGKKALCMREGVSVAAQESAIRGLEKKGRHVVLVAEGGRLLGWVVLQDDLAHGARAAVEIALRAEVEPVLLSGSSRDAAEALGLSLGIEHVRPDVLRDECGAEVRALATSGACVGVIGTAEDDDAALGAAGVAIALGAAGAAQGEWSIRLAARKPDLAAEAVTLAKSVHDVPGVALALTALPGALVALGLSTGLVPVDVAWLAPAAGGLGLGLAHWRLER